MQLSTIDSNRRNGYIDSEDEADVSESRQRGEYPDTNQDHIKSRSRPAFISGYESIVRFLLLPRQAGVVLLLEFLNSFRSFGLRIVIYNYITNEYGITDTQAGKILGIKGVVDIIFGLLGSILVDIMGVRKVSVLALSIAMIGRTLVAFGRNRMSLFFALYFFSPCGDSLLAIGIYRVALKKLTTPLTRPLAFAVSYAAWNLSSALADVVVDKMRNSVSDFELDESYGWLSGVYTPIRQFIVVTWVFVIITFFIAFCFLRDETVIDLDDIDDYDTSSQTCQENRGGADNNDARWMNSVVPHDATPSIPMISRRILKKWFPKQFTMVHSHEDEEADQRQMNVNDPDPTNRLISLPNYKVYRTKYAYESQEQVPTSVPALRNPCRGLLKVIKQIITILMIQNTWKVLIFGFASFSVAMQWTASEIVLPPFLERRYGESIPIYTIQSINLFGCLIMPPIVGALTTGTEDFQIVMPGLWIMACSPIFIALLPNVFGACVWQLVLTIGEVLWSPRQDSWTASLAPIGMEGFFFAFGSSRELFGPLGDVVMGAMNEKYNTNCLDCRDQYGHFCQNLSNSNGTLQCVSVQESCGLFPTALGDDTVPTCPTTCLECPTWEPTDPSAFWYLLMLFSILTPLSVWVFLPFLRGGRDRNDGCYGVFRMSKRRLLGICGAKNDARSSYDHVRAHESFDSEFVVSDDRPGVSTELEFA
mmetsp:Transcript_5512/g.11735  ORF Transcript_5512/g.11735 Transcript_5512/m.11735 type:complete len:705 (+) Transcript_5512:129-2243(+)